MTNTGVEFCFFLRANAHLCITSPYVNVCFTCFDLLCSQEWSAITVWPFGIPVTAGSKTFPGWLKLWFQFLLDLHGSLQTLMNKKCLFIYLFLMGVRVQPLLQAPQHQNGLWLGKFFKVKTVASTLVMKEKRKPYMSIFIPVQLLFFLSCMSSSGFSEL